MLRLERNSVKVEDGRFCEYVGKLGGGWDVEDPNIADGDPIMNEV